MLIEGLPRNRRRRQQLDRAAPPDGTLTARQPRPAALSTLTDMAGARARALAAALAAIALVSTTSMAPVARADGDPASDVLLGANVFYPYSPAVSRPLQRRLDAATAAAAKRHAPVKVALIASPTDLGVIPDLFNKPQDYADFLEQEISFNGPAPILIVMPHGYGTKGLPGSASDAVAALAKPAGRSSDALATAAIAAVGRIAAAEGHPIPGLAAGTASDSGNSTTLVIALLAGAALAAATALVIVAVRRRRAPA
jgi:hypothetical protein